MHNSPDPDKVRDLGSTEDGRSQSYGPPATSDGPPEFAAEHRDTGIVWTGIALLTAIVVVLMIVFQNTQTVQFEFLWADVDISLSLLLIITFGLALVIGEIIGYVWRRRRRELRHLRQR